jgi:drug/metabolite transporter (DMT)-like permease
MKKQTLSSLLCLLAAAIWGFAFTAQKAAAAVPPFMLTAARGWIAGLFLILVTLGFDKLRGGKRRLFSKQGIDITRVEWIGGAVCGLVLASASVFQQFGIQDTDAGKTAFITALYVVIVPIYSIFLGRRSPLHVWISVAIAVVGFYFLCIDGELHIATSDVFVLLCAIVFPVQILTIDSFANKCDGVRMSAIQFISASIVNLILAFALETPIAFTEIKGAIGAILFLGIVSSGIAYTMQIIGQKGTNPAVASVIMSLESVFGVIGSAIFLKQTLSLREYAGAAIVFIAVILSELDVKALFKKKKAENP